MATKEPRPRSEETRKRILEAASRQFEQRGYDRATIRSIASEAGIDPSMVMRYFGSKEKLFTLAAPISLQLPDLSEVPRDEMGERVVRHFLKRWDQDRALFAVLRSAATDPAAAEQARGIFARQLVPVVAAVVPDPDEALTRAALMASQVLGIALCRFILEIPPVVAMGVEEAVRWYGPTLQRYLTED
ncbi:TetR/AcrR family transcriptional regulator [Salininema proteolyticum]|uniref:TetR family transcriptional regulator n=1 Tax=Salininema proteolyticum TaxID=1607685 RepID=A0ABV8U2V7_9ACTN